MNPTVAIAAAVLLGFAVSGTLGLSVVPWIRQRQFGEKVPAFGKHPKEKAPVPTMGGILVFVGMIASFLTVLLTDALLGGSILVGDTAVPLEMQTKILSGLFTAVAFGLIGLADDALKAMSGRFVGLTTAQKIVAELFVTAAYLVSLFLSMGNKPYMYIPFVGNIELGWFYPLIVGTMILVTVQSLQSTERVDGLSGGIAWTAAVSIGTIAVLRSLFGVGLLAAALVGSCSGFLLWNRAPAKITVGKTGSMFLSGALCALCCAVGCPLLLPMVTLASLVQGLSVCAVRHARTRKNLCRALTERAWSDRKISAVLVTANLFGCVAAVLCMKR